MVEPVSMDREQLEEFFERVADRFSAAELVELLEDAGIISIWTIIARLEEEIVEAREKLEV